MDEHDVDHHEMVDLELPLQTAQGEGININEFLSNQINNPGWRDDFKWLDTGLMLNGKSAWEMDSKENVFDKQEAYDDIKGADVRLHRVENSAISDRMYFENEFA